MIIRCSSGTLGSISRPWVLLKPVGASKVWGKETQSQAADLMCHCRFQAEG